MDFDRLHEHYSHFFEHFEKKYDQVFFMAIDAEWYEHGGRNVVLSYQAATASRDKSANVIKYMPHGERLRLADIVEMGVRSVTAEQSFKTLRGRKTLIVMVAHNIVAEWSVLKDRDEPHITRRLALVRKSPITDGHPIKITVAKTFPADVLLYDTMLLAPASHQSLRKLSALLGPDDKQKESVSQYYIEHMDRYLMNHPEKFERYALRDSEVTLKLFFLLQESLNTLVYGDSGFQRLFRTLASAGVKSFTDKNAWFKPYRDELRKSKFSMARRLIKRSYLGGRNEGYFIGRTGRHPETRDKFWVDIDFSGCYPTAMALCPKIDVGGDVDHILLRYELDDETAARLEADNIPAEIIADARNALADSQEAFDRALSEIPRGDLERKIRSAATVIDNRLIDRWHAAWKTARETGDTAIEKFLVPGFARVRFKFPAGTRFPCLPKKHVQFGLLYLLEGETVLTAAEIVLAMEAGAEVEALTSLELPVETDENGAPKRFVLEHLSQLAAERNRYKKEKDDPTAQVYERLLKEFMNSFYGKFSQSINTRNVYKPATGEMVSLGESTITEPCTASLLTSLARAALSAVLIAVERFNRDRPLQDQITVISATTDGLLIGIPAPKGFSVVEDYYDMIDGVPRLKRGVDRQLAKILERFNCSGMLDEMDRFLPIRQMRNSRSEMTGSSEILEIKHMADEIISVKTRGQIGLLSSGHTSILARFGHKPPLSEIIEDPEEYKRIMETGGVVRDTEDADWIRGHIDRIESGDDKIGTYTFITLTNFRKMIQSGGTLDLVKRVSKRKINTDFDWKRKLIWKPDGRNRSDGISPFTVPHLNVAEMLRHRWQMESIRRTGRVASPDKVLQRMKVQGRTVRIRGSEPEAIARLFLRGVLQGEILLKGDLDTYSVIARKLNVVWEEADFTESYPKVWSVNDLKNAKRGIWEPGCIYPNGMLEDLVTRLARALEIDPLTARETIFAVEEFEATHAKLIVQVITAVLNAPRKVIAPFHELYQMGRLPDIDRIRDTFRERLSDEQIDGCIGRTYIPGQRPSRDAKKLKKLFYALGIPGAEAGKCAESVAPSLPVDRTRTRNPGEKKCTDHFVRAVLATTIGDAGYSNLDAPFLISRLQRFGLTRDRYYRLKRENFDSNGIKDLLRNRQQIQKMAKACNLNPNPLLDVLIER